MLDHVSLRVQDFPRALAFYRAALAPIGYQVAMEFPGAAGLGERGKPDLWITLTDKPLLPTHIAFRTDRARVDAFHAAALAAGGIDNGPPGAARRLSPALLRGVRDRSRRQQHRGRLPRSAGRAQAAQPARARAASPRRPAKKVKKPPRKPANARRRRRPRSGGSARRQRRTRSRTRPIVAGALMAATIALPAGVSARPRPRFEPTDLEWEETGVFEVDVEFGADPQPGPVALRDPRLRARLRHPPQRRARPRRRLRASRARCRARSRSTTRCPTACGRR